MVTIPRISLERDLHFVDFEGDCDDQLVVSCWQIEETEHGVEDDESADNDICQLDPAGYLHATPLFGLSVINLFVFCHFDTRYMCALNYNYELII